MSDRQQCYDEIRAIVSHSLTTYYRAHPEYLGDVRATDGVRAVSGALAQVLTALEKYDIKRRKGMA